MTSCKQRNSKQRNSIQLAKAGNSLRKITRDWFVIGTEALSANEITSHVGNCFGLYLIVDVWPGNRLISHSTVRELLNEHVECSHFITGL
jgi:hypothetical protein